MKRQGPRGGTDAAEQTPARQDDPRVVYADIIDLPHWRSPTRQPMRERDRAAQFAPFAALTGYAEMVEEQARETGQEIALEDWAQARLSAQMNRLESLLAAGERPRVRITWFVPDARKAGGRYVTAEETVRRLDRTARLVILARREGAAGRYASIPMDRILRLSGPELEEET